MHGQAAIWWPRPLPIHKGFLATLLLLLGALGYAQEDIRSHQWKERVIVILADKDNVDKGYEQMQWFQKFPEDLDDRNLTDIYLCKLPECSYTGNKEFNTIMERAREGGSFIVLLIGLDGSIKYQSNQLEAPQVYCNLIDRMPMRRAQMRKRIKRGGGL